MNPELALAVLGIIANGAVTWGIVSTKLDWLRRDLDELAKRMNTIEKVCA